MGTDPSVGDLIALGDGIVTALVLDVSPDGVVCLARIIAPRSSRPAGTLWWPREECRVLVKRFDLLMGMLEDEA